MTASSDVILRVEDLRKYYPVNAGLLTRLLGDEGYLKAVNGVSFELTRGQNLGIIGESGSGKSTLLESLARLEEPTSGRVVCKDLDVRGLSAEELRRFRKDVQIIFQDPYESLNPKKSIFQIVSEPLRNFTDDDHDELVERVEEILFDVGLRPPGEFRQKYPDQLSGGERQRVNIARAVVLEPDLLFADEPLSMLDVSIQSGIIKLLSDLQEKIGFTLVYVTHNISVARLICDEVAVMYRGEFVEQGDADVVLSDPKHPYTEKLMDSLPDISGGRERVILPDTSQRDASLPEGCSFHPKCEYRMDECTVHEPKLSEAEGRLVACFKYHDEVRPPDGGD